MENIVLVNVGGAVCVNVLVALVDPAVSQLEAAGYDLLRRLRRAGEE